MVSFLISLTFFQFFQDENNMFYGVFDQNFPDRSQLLNWRDVFGLAASVNCWDGVDGMDYWNGLNSWDGLDCWDGLNSWDDLDCWEGLGCCDRLDCFICSACGVKLQPLELPQ